MFVITIVCVAIAIIVVLASKVGPRDDRHRSNVGTGNPRDRALVHASTLLPTSVPTRKTRERARV